MKFPFILPPHAKRAESQNAAFAKCKCILFFSRMAVNDCVQGQSREHGSKCRAGPDYGGEGRTQHCPGYLGLRTRKMGQTVMGNGVASFEFFKEGFQTQKFINRVWG